MDWNSILTLINGVDTLLGAVILVLAARYGYRALRSWLRRRSEPMPYVSADLGHEEYHHLHLKRGLVSKRCDLCNPQPASQPPSAPTTGTGTGKGG